MLEIVQRSRLEFVQRRRLEIVQRRRLEIVQRRRLEIVELLQIWFHVTCTLCASGISTLKIKSLKVLKNFPIP